MWIIVASNPGAVEEVSDGEERCQDVLEGPVPAEVLHALLEVTQGLSNLLLTHTHTTTYTHTTRLTIPLS